MSDLIVSAQWDILNVELDGTYQEITFPHAVKGFRIKARGEQDILHKKTEAATAYSTMKAGTAEPFTVYLTGASNSLGWFRMAGGTDTAEIYVFY